MFNLFYRNRQLLFLSLTLIVVWGFSAFLTLPRLEDPEIVQRVSTITTVFPGASAERVESLVTEKIEDEFSDIEEIDNIESTSSPNISVVTIELKDTVANVAPVWAKIRSELDDVIPELPPEALEPRYEDADVKANAMLVGLTWTLDTPANYTLMQRIAEGLENQLEAIPGTDKVELFGISDEEIQISIDQAAAARLGLSAQSVAAQIQASDAKVSAGTLQSATDNLLFEVDSNLQSLERIRQLPIRLGNSGQISQLGDIATIRKTVRAPAAEQAIVSGRPAVVLALQVESNFRVDDWAKQAHQVLSSFESDLSEGLQVEIVLDQSLYVRQRLNGVLGNLVLSSSLVVLVSLLMLGWRSALIVGLALPLSTLMVFGAMKSLGIPLHQMSVTGLIIALGLLIDNAIVVVDEVQIRLRAGMHPAMAVSETVRHLIVPLMASTLTTVLAFLPIATSPGGTGEFIGTIGSTVILALLSSLVLSLSAIAALIGLIYRRWPSHSRSSTAITSWWEDGFSNQALSIAYTRSLLFTFRRPLLGIGVAMILPVVGFVQFASLPQQFFPPTNRDQFQIEFELPAQSAIALTQSQVLAARDRIREHPAVEDVHWFLGKSAPSFFYNVVAAKEDAADYAQGIVQLNNTDNLRETIAALQQQLDAAFPQAQVLVRQLEQGPPFPAPIELRLYGSDMTQLREIGNQLRGKLATIPNVIHTRAGLAEAQPKLALSVDEVTARRTGLDNAAIATQLNATLEGAVGGSLLEDTEDIAVRVRVGDKARGDLSAIASTDLITPSSSDTIPLSALANVSIVPDIATIAHYNGQRINTIQAFLTAGALPDTALTQFKKQLEESNFELPAGYRMEYGGEADARGSAVGNLLASVGVLAILMVATLVLSFNSFAIAALLGVVAIAAIGLAAMALWLFKSIFGFTAILGTLGLIGLAINDSIVVLAALKEDAQAQQGNVKATVDVVVKATRHVAATTVTTIIGFVPLMLDKTGFWPPLAIAIAGGLGGATLLALYFIPAAHILLTRKQVAAHTLH
ncbi:MAG: efflux RND transporter permease subunit [Cyanobacteria bacterium J06626_6]